jgi:hypothetical protein
MPFDPEAVRRRAATFTPRRPAGIAGIIAGVHRDPALAQWLPMESGALLPVPTRVRERWELWSLVAVVRQTGSGAEEYAVPWGCVQWDLPSGRIGQLVDLARRPDLAAALEAARDAGPASWRMDGVPAGAREALLTRLDEVTSGTGDELATLGPAYAELLPAGALDLYRAVVPGVQAWLRPANTASVADVTKPVADVTNPVADVTKPVAEVTKPVAATVSGPQPEKSPALALGPLVRRAERLTGQVDGEQAAALTEGFARLARRRDDTFRIAVCGTSGAVRATVDVLLGAPVLPSTRAVPPVVVGRSAEARLELPPETTLPLAAASWDRVPENAVAVRAFLDVDFLRALDGEVEVAADGAEPTGADVLLLAVTAASSLGLTEREFLDQQVRSAHVQRVAVIITGLEEVDTGERDGVIRYVAKRAEQVHPGIDVLVLPAAASADTEIKELREAVLRLGDAAARPRLRESQVLGLLTDHAAALVVAAAESEEAALRKTQQREAERREAEQRIDDRRVDWLAVRNELRQRGTRNVDALRRSLLAFREDLLERLRFDLKRSRDPRQWWDEDLPFRLRRELEAAVRRYEGQLENSTTADLEWLDSRCRELFGRSVATGPGLRGPLAPDDPELRQIDAPDLARYRLGFRIAPAVAGLLGVLFIPGGIIAMGLASAVALAAGELKLQGMVAEQHDQVAAALPGAVDRAIDAVSDQLSNRIRELYSGLLDDIERGSRTWQDAALATIHRSGETPDEGANRRALGTEARELLAELRATTTAGETR